MPLNLLSWTNRLLALTHNPAIIFQHCSYCGIAITFNCFSTAFALFIATVFDRNTNLIATGISVVTCIVAGCFIEINTNNPVLAAIFKIIPQTEFMELVHGIEFGKNYFQFRYGIAYILLCFLWL